MPRLCSVCKLKKDRRVEVEAVALSDGPREAARRFKLSHQAIGRHLAADHHVRDGAPKVSPPEAPPAAPEPAALRPLKRPRPGTVPARPAKERFPYIAALTTPQERKRYLGKLFSQGRFEGLRTSELLAQIWDDLNAVEFSQLLTQASMEADFRRGSSQARRVALIGIVEQAVRRVAKRGDDKALANLVKLWAQLDGVLLAETDAAVALASSRAWQVAASVLQQRYPDAHAAIHAALAADQLKTHVALAPPVVEQPDAAE